MSAGKPVSIVDDVDPIAETRPARGGVGRAEAEAAVRSLIRWAGDDPEREGVRGTPERVVRAFEEYFSGYLYDPVEVLESTFDEHEGYDEIVVLRDGERLTFTAVLEDRR